MSQCRFSEKFSDITTSRWRYLLIILTWAGIFLPGIDSLELTHEEPRRALPALHMVQSGDWLVPRVGSEPYLRKPPLLNWLIALSFKMNRRISDGSARIPSALATLALALVIVGIAGNSWLRQSARGLLAAVFFLTNLAILESGRLAELEALYVALIGIALVVWLTLWLDRRNAWLMWLFPAPFLALGLLTKGPTEFLFYYGIIVPVLFRAKEFRLLMHPAHWIALGFIAGVFFLWAIPCSIAINGEEPGLVWKAWFDQIGSRATLQPGEHFSVVNYLENGPLSLKNFLPWTLFLPLVWSKKLSSTGRESSLYGGARLGMVIVFLIMTLLPSASPRYLYPLFPIPCLLLEKAVLEAAKHGTRTANLWHTTSRIVLVIAFITLLVAALGVQRSPGSIGLLLVEGVAVAVVLWSFSRQNGAIPSDPKSRMLGAALASGLIMVMAMGVYSIAVIPQINSAHKTSLHQFADECRKALPPGEKIWTADFPYRPFWYYLEPDIRYYRAVGDIPVTGRFVLISAQDAEHAARETAWTEARPVLIKTITEKTNKKLFLYELTARRPS